MVMTLTRTAAPRSRQDRGNGARIARIRRGVVLLLGALAIEVFISRGPLRFYYVPLFAGVTYLAAALVSGKRGTAWAAGLVFTWWGLWVVGTAESPYVAQRSTPMLLLCLGTAVLMAGLLSRLGYAIDLLSVGLAMILGGVFFLLETHSRNLFGEDDFYAALLAVWGLYELLPVVMRRSR